MPNLLATLLDPTQSIRTKSIAGCIPIHLTFLVIFPRMPQPLNPSLRFHDLQPLPLLPLKGGRVKPNRLIRFDD